MPRSILAKARWWRAGRHALVALLASIAVLPNLSAAAAPAQPAAGDDLRAAFATPQDIAEGKRVALASCASCHAITGIALARGTPHIAGQRPAYLYAELRVYQAGRRGNNADEQCGQVPERRCAGESGRLLREPRSRATCGRKRQEGEQGRSAERRQGRRGRMFGLSRRRPGSAKHPECRTSLAWTQNISATQSAPTRPASANTA